MARRILASSGITFAALAFLLAVAGGVLLLLPNTGIVQTCDEAGRCTDVSGWSEGGEGGLMLFWSVLVSAVAAIPLVIRSALVRLGVGILLLAFCIMGSMSIGFAFAPAAIFMLIASALPPRRAIRRGERDADGNDEGIDALEAERPRESTDAT